MKTVDREDILMADTPHARLARQLVVTGAFREPRLERLAEAAALLHDTSGGKKQTIRTTAGYPKTRAEAVQRASQAGMDVFLYYANMLPDAEQDKLYEVVANIMSMRLNRSEQQAGDARE